MKRRDKTVLWIAVVLVAAISIGGAAIATTLTGAGSIDIDIDDDGSRIKMSLPASVVFVALQLMPDSALEEIPEEAVKYAGLARAVSKELRDLPDFTLVEVEGRHEHVIVQKRGDRLVVDVEDRESVVHVSFPIQIVDKVAKKIEKGRVFL
jgi:hypothetical protein